MDVIKAANELETMFMKYGILNSSIPQKGMEKVEESKAVKYTMRVK